MTLLGLFSLFQLALAEPCPKGAIKRRGKIKHEDIDEASGLIATENWIWIHNDSGDSATLYAIDRSGNRRATSRIDGAFARDWEDMTDFSENGTDYFLIGDIGDNKERLPEVTFYVIERPSSDTPSSLLYTFTATYDTIGAKDAEAIVVDPITKELLLITKGRDGVFHFLQGKLPLPSEYPSDKIIDDPKFNANKIVLSEIHQEPFATPPLNRQEQSRFITSATLHPSGNQLVIRNYLTARIYTKTAEQSWAEGLKNTPCRLPLPLQQQGETLDFSPDGNSLWTTSEGSKQSLYEIQLSYP